MLRVLFRADGGPTIGDGHLMRCLALAQHIVDLGGMCRLVTADLSTRPIGDWRDDKIPVETLLCEAASDADAQSTVLASKKMQADFVVVDGYAFTSAYFARLAEERMGSLRFDDTCERSLKADIVVNQNAGADERCRDLKDDRALLGCDYVMLRRSLRAVPARSAAEHPHLLFTLGGYDPDNLAPAIAAAILRQTTALTATLVFAGGSSAYAEAREWAGLHAGQVEMVPPGNIDDQMIRADLAICAGGTTSLELASLGVPMVIVIRADNQRAGAYALEQAGCAVVAGEGRAAVAFATQKACELLADPQARRRMSDRARRLVDGRGVERVVAVMQDFVQQRRVRQ